jgi:predicted transcriptional regulator
MKLEEIKTVLDCKVIACSDMLNTEIDYCFAADLMSDVLRYARTGSLLLTGITNAQVLQVSEIMDIKAILFVRGKIPPKNVIKQAEVRKIPVLSTEKLMFDACGILYSLRLRGGKTHLEEIKKNEQLHPVI